MKHANLSLFFPCRLVCIYRQRVFGSSYLLIVKTLKRKFTVGHPPSMSQKLGKNKKNRGDK